MLALGLGDLIGPVSWGESDSVDGIAGKNKHDEMANTPRASLSAATWLINWNLNPAFGITDKATQTGSLVKALELQKAIAHVGAFTEELGCAEPRASKDRPQH